MQVLHQLPKVRDADLLVGFESADDAAVYRISEHLAMVSTVDFFPPIVDSPDDFGRIAAANALSDVYAMGARPATAMNVVAFPSKLDISILGEIISGAVSTLDSAGCTLVGGHTIEDTGIKYGLSVTGFIDPVNLMTNTGAVVGDRLVLTKPIGTGVVANALKGGRISLKAARPVIKSMTTLNRAASEVAVELGVKGCTDITGYGLLGHAMEMANGSKTNFVFDSAAVPFFDLALELVSKKSNRPGAIANTREYLGTDVIIDESVSVEHHQLLTDPQTSGGLLLSVNESKVDRLMTRLQERSVHASIVGSVVARTEGWSIRVE
ncbi:MAG: selenide, water dikinase SelD [Proteobacteria bacterium]|nr:selenide, water dikinase SelD [Pseudomonadota bacterium]